MQQEELQRLAVCRSPTAHLAVSSATCSPTPRNAAISSIDSSVQLQAGDRRFGRVCKQGSRLTEHTHGRMGTAETGCALSYTHELAGTNSTPRICSQGAVDIKGEGIR